MRSIFAKSLLWAIGTTAVSLIGFALTTRLIWGYLPGQVDLIGRMLVLQREDQRAYKQGGQECLAGYLRRLDELFEAKHSLVDATAGIWSTAAIDPPWCCWLRSLQLRPDGTATKASWPLHRPAVDGFGRQSTRNSS